MDLYGLQCIGVGAGLILNLPPSTEGIVEPSFVQWAGEFNEEWTRRFGEGASIGGTNVTTALATNLGPGNGMMEVPFKEGKHAVDHVVIKEDLRRGQRIAGWQLDIQVGQPTGAKDWVKVAAGSTIGSSRIIPLGQPGRGQFVPGRSCVGVPQCEGSGMANTFGVRFRPTISVAADALVYVAELRAFHSNASLGSVPSV